MTIVENFAAQPIHYREARRDQRLLLPRFRIVVDGYILPTLNWSLGGMLLDGAGPAGAAPNLPVTGLIAGETRRGPASIPFSALVSRLVSSPLSLALCFAKVDVRVVDFLEDCLLHHMSRYGAR